MEKGLYDRRLRAEVMDYLDGKEALMILGARQVGKTSLLKLIMERLKGEVLYFDLERERDLSIVEEGAEYFLSYLKASGKEKKAIVFIDEVQYMKDPAKFIKIMVDYHSQEVKLILTGSSTLGIRQKFKDSLAGRKLLFILYPLDFREFLYFKGEDHLAQILPEDPFTFNGEDKTRFFTEKYSAYLDEYLIFGGYPRVALEIEAEKRIRYIEEIVNAYIYKDVRNLFKIEDITKYNKLVKLLGVQIGNLLNIFNVAQDIGISRITVAKYLKMLEDTFILYLLPPFYTNPKKEIVKNPKVYLLDNGLRNYLVGDFKPLRDRVDKGRLFENAVLGGLLKKRGRMENLYFWRTQTKAEVDFIIEREDKLIPLEANLDGRPTKSLYSFMKRYRVEEGYVVYPGEYRKEKSINFIPGWWVV